MILSSLKYKINRVLSIFFSVIFFPLSLFFFFLILIFNSSFENKIRIFPVTSSRIGHYISEILIYFSEKKKFKKKEITICYNRPFVCNDFLNTLLKRNFFFLPWFFLNNVYIITSFLKKYFPSLSFIYISDFETRFGRDINFSLLNFYDSIQLKNNENKKGQKILDKINKNKKKIILFFARDDEYLSKEFNSNKEIFSYSEHRNWDNSVFIESINFFISKGYFVFRVSKFSNQKIIVDSPYFHDLAFSDYRSDFFEIFLASKCEFCFGTDTGSIHMAISLFKKPFCGFFLPIFDIHTYLENSLMATKRLFYQINNKELTLNEIISEKLYFKISKKILNEKKIVAKDLTSSEILDICKEFYGRLKNTYSDDYLSNVLQKKFWDLFFNKTDKELRNKMHGERSLIFFSNSFLKKNIEWLN